MSGAPRGRRVAVALAAWLAASCGLTDHARPPFEPSAGDHVSCDAPDADPSPATAAPAGRDVVAAVVAAPQIRLADLLRAADAVSAEVAAARAEVLAATGRAWQAGLHPNPSVEITREGPFDDRPWGRSQFLVGLRQPLVVSDRRSLSAAAELAERDVRALDVETARRRVHGDVRAAFAEILHLRDAAALQRELIAVAEKSLDLARERVAAKVAIDVEALKPEIDVQSLRSGLVDVERRRDAAGGVLAALLGGVAVPLDRLVRETRPAAAPEPLEALSRRARETHPAARAAREAIRAASARLEAARTEARPDVEVGFAVGRDLDGNDFVAEIGVEIPLAVFDAGQGRVLEAQALVSKARREADAVEAALAVEVARRFGERETARARLDDLRTRLLPLAERSLDATLAAYRGGRVEFLDLLDAQRTLLDVRAGALAHQRDLDAADAEIRTLTGDAP